MGKKSPVEKRGVFNEGMVKKGGINPEPPGERPAMDIPGQGDQAVSAPGPQPRPQGQQAEAEK